MGRVHSIPHRRGWKGESNMNCLDYPALTFMLLGMILGFSIGFLILLIFNR